MKVSPGTGGAGPDASPPQVDLPQDRSTTIDGTAVDAQPTVLTKQEAEELTQTISLKLGVIADNTEAVMPLIREAIERNAYLSLGYASHGAYVADRFGDTLARLETVQRRDVVQELTAAGLSTRAIAPIVGVDQSTVVRDLRSTHAVQPDLSSPAVRIHQVMQMHHLDP